MGLSPRARGHRRISMFGDVAKRTIPAGAGSPADLAALRIAETDYPRGRGVTDSSGATASLGSGLSPRARGHPFYERREDRLEGTIPAGAGSPLDTSCLGHLERDYPRGRGVTRDRALWTGRCRGLSPRARGHRRPAANRRQKSRTIPAGAGSPSERTTGGRSFGDYPRGRGVT